MGCQADNRLHQSSTGISCRIRSSSVKLGQPFHGFSLGLVVAYKHKVLGRPRHADTRIERQQYREEFAELKTRQTRDFRLSLVARPGLPGALFQIGEFGRDCADVRGPGGPGFGQFLCEIG